MRTFRGARFIKRYGASPYYICSLRRCVQIQDNMISDLQLISSFSKTPLVLNGCKICTKCELRRGPIPLYIHHFNDYINIVYHSYTSYIYHNSAFTIFTKILSPSIYMLHPLYIIYIRDWEILERE